MSKIAISEIFNPHIDNLYQEINDKELIEKNHLLLNEIYTFELIIDDFDYEKDSMFTAYGDSMAMIVKLDECYYLTAIDGCDGYRDNRGKIYGLQFDTTELRQILNKKNIINTLSSPIEVNLTHDMRSSHDGIVFLINDYLQNEEGILITWSTDGSDSYYPSGIIYFNESVFLAAAPILEKQQLDKKLEQATDSQKKLKI